MGRPVGSKQPREPETEGEELAFYKALHFLRESTIDEDEAKDALITVYRQQCEYIAAIRPFMGWEDIGRILGVSKNTAQRRFQEYSNAGAELNDVLE